MSELPSLPDALARFHRKERRRLIERALGSSDTPTEISAGFLDEIRSLGISLDDKLQWFMDYHIDWLVGAFCLFQLRVTALNALQREDNKDVTLQNNKTRKLIAGNQEDFDLVLADESTVVCIEVKWFDAWDYDVLSDKICRAERAVVLAATLAKDKGHLPRKVNLHFLALTLGGSNGDDEKWKIGRSPNKDGPQWEITHAGFPEGGLVGRLSRLPPPKP